MSTALLLNHLHNANPSVTTATLFAALAHHLAHDRPTPTSLAATAVSAPFFLTYPPSHERIQGLVTAFHHAVLLKREALIKAREASSTFARSLFSLGVTYDLQEWVRQAHQGLRGGRPLFRLAASTGLLLGVNQVDGFHGKCRSKVEDDIAVAVAEVLDDYTLKTGDWEREFGPHIDETALSLTLIIASQSLPLLPNSKLDALPLGLLAPLLVSSMATSFLDGAFTRVQLDASPGTHGSQAGNSAFSESSAPSSQKFAPEYLDRLHAVSTSPTMTYMSSLSKLLSLVIGILVTSWKDGLEVANDVLGRLDNVARAIERGWLDNPLSVSTKADDAETEDIARSTWTLLKTCLFAIVMVLDGALGSVVYRRPDDRQQLTLTTPHDIAQLSLQILSHLSFVVSQFGGVTASYSEDRNSFTELNKVFYLALDILNYGQSQERCESFVQGLLADLSMTHDSIRHEKTAFVFACIEQCVPRLGASCLEEHVLVACVPYLSDPTHREIYESAHSVVLSIFASHAHPDESGHQGFVELPGPRADRQTLGDESRVSHTSKRNGDMTNDQRQSPSGSVDLIRRMVPFYAQCLIENSKERMLSTAQLRLAYAALVKGGFAANSIQIFDGSLGWYCVNLLADEIKSLASAVGDSSKEQHEARLHQLRLTLVSTISALPLSYLVPALELVLLVVFPHETAGIQPIGDDPGKREELVEALFHAIQDVGDIQKTVALRWWYENWQNFGLAREGDVREKSVEKGIEKEGSIRHHDPPELSHL